MAGGTERPNLNLMRGGEDLTVEDVVEFYQAITGRTPTPEEIEKAWKILAGEID
jgi:hypothetical protein